MAKKKTGPPARALKWIEEYRQGKHQGCTPTPEHNQSIWDASYIPDRCTPATPKLIKQTESRLGVTLPASIREQFLI